MIKALLIAILFMLSPLTGLASGHSTKSTLPPSYAVVELTTDHFSGSGFVIGNGKYVVTAAHVINGDGKLKVTVNFQDQKQMTATVVWMDSRMDAAVLMIDDADSAEGGAPVSREVACREPNQDEAITVAGYPFGLPYTITHGTVASARIIDEDSEHWDHGYFLASAIANHGDSGGPAFDKDGKVIGILVGGIGKDNSAFSIIIAINDVCNGFLKHEKIAS